MRSFLPLQGFTLQLYWGRLSNKAGTGSDSGHYRKDTAGRFTGRAAWYSRQRPGYPDAIIGILEREVNWRPDAIVADIGAGTGISSELFLRHGNEVHAVEPNPEMRAAAAALAIRYPKFTVTDGTAESTGLAATSVDFVVAATAFHWFDPVRSRAEFRRILKPGGFVILLWNERRQSTPFLTELEAVIGRFGERHPHPGVVSAQFFENGSSGIAHLSQIRSHDFEGLRERILSSSWAPLPGHPKHAPLMSSLEDLFDRFQENGRVEIEYGTSVIWGRAD